MPHEFTFAAFETFCHQAATIPVYCVADYLTLQPSTTPVVILRLDVDYREPHAIALAEIAARYDLRGSFYFRHHESGFDQDAIHTIAGLGHEIGFHFETLDHCQGDFDAAETLFLDQLTQLRETGIPVRTVAAHGGQPTANTYRANFDLFTQRPDLFMRAGLVGETTVSIDFSPLTYASDALWHWRCYRNYSHGAHGQPCTLREITRSVSDRDIALYINFHPHQWFATPVQARFFRLRNRIGRVVLSYPLALKRQKQTARLNHRYHRWRHP